MGTTREETMGLLLDEIVGHLRSRIKTKEIEPSELKTAVELLKNNGITCEVRKGTPIGFLKDELPFSEDELNDIN